MHPINQSGYTVNYVEREEWGGGPVRRGSAIPEGDVHGIVCHHTVMASSDYDGDGVSAGDFDDMSSFMRSLQTARPDLGNEVPYSFVVFNDPDPRVAWMFEGRGIGRSGVHTKGHNYDRYGVAYEGNSINTPPTDAVIRGAYRLARSWTTMEAPTTGHKDWAATACPGDGVYNRISEIDITTVETSSNMYMVKLPDGKYDVVLPGIGHNPEINDPVHWAQVILDAGTSGIYESPYMGALMDDRFVWEGSSCEVAGQFDSVTAEVAQQIDSMRTEIMEWGDTLQGHLGTVQEKLNHLISTSTATSLEQKDGTLKSVGKRLWKGFHF